MTLTDQTIKAIINHVIKGEDYRIEVVNTLNAAFLDFTIDFFKQIVSAKLNSTSITIDWYKNTFLDESLPKEIYANNAGLNMKTIKNMYKTEARQVVLDASNEHFDSFYNCIEELVQADPEIDLTLTIKFQGVSVDLNVSESLIVINTLAVKRAALSGGIWSSVGKRSEKMLMLTLCKMYNVSPQYYNAEHFVKDRTLAVDREVDFYFKTNSREYRCEVKLMGAGNPGSADAIIARDSDIFIADTLSMQNKNQCEQLGKEWVALRDPDGYKKFATVLDNLGIPHNAYNGNIDNELPGIIDELFN
ncbi:MAG: CfrBI family restriction endonuclease [Alistipes sp.]|nr:CfrBI family restriction endonuclease [Alistipes sp.]